MLRREQTKFSPQVQQQKPRGSHRLARHSSDACSHSREKDKQRWPGRSELPAEGVSEVCFLSTSYEIAGTTSTQDTLISNLKIS